MSSKTKKLTKSVVDALVPTGKLFRLFDSEVKGFSVRVGPSGDKRWQLDYRPHPGGRNIPKKRLTIAVVGVLTPDEARAAPRRRLQRSPRAMIRWPKRLPPATREQSPT